MNIPVISIALLGFLTFLGGVNTTFVRGKYNINGGCPDDQTHPLYKAVRAHGNTAEYAPILAVLIYVLAQLNPPVWVLFFMVLATFFRYLIFVGIMMAPTLAKPYLIRAIGAIGTYICGITLCIALALQVIG